MNSNHYTYKDEAAFDGDSPWEPVMELTMGRARHSRPVRHRVNRTIRTGRADHEAASGVLS